MSIMVLAGNHAQYISYVVHSCGLSSYTKDYCEGPQLGIHVDQILVIGTFRERPDAKKELQYAKICLVPKGRIVYADIPAGWYISKWDVNGDPILKDSDGQLRCNWCRGICHETFSGGMCSKCHNAGEIEMKIPTMGEKYGMFTTKGKFQPKEGDIWKLPKASSPMWTEQWGYQGSAKAPYIVSKRDADRADGSTTGDGWACSCPNFTRHTPRTPCKHVLNVQLKEGLSNKKAAVKLANVDEAKLAAFEEWQRQEAARKQGHKVTAGAKLNYFGATGRKFR